MENNVSQMTNEEKLRQLLDYNPYKEERNIVYRYVMALRHDDAEQIAYFEGFGNNIRQIIMNVNTYERGLIFGYVGKQFNEYGWLSCKIPIVEEIRLNASNAILIGLSVNGTYVVSVDWNTGTAGGGSHPSIWSEPIAEYKKAVREGIRQLEEKYEYAENQSRYDRGNFNPTIIRRLKAGLQDIRQKYLSPQQLSLF